MGKGFIDVYGRGEKRKFGGKFYKYLRTFWSKREAEEYANEIKRLHRARVVKAKSGDKTVYRVYYRKGKGKGERILKQKGIEIP